MHIQEAAHALNARWQGQDVLFTGVSTDSRTLHQGDLFVALSGERFDGHRFVDAAQRQGAVAAMVKLEFDETALATEFPLMRVSNTQLGLGQLAAYWRKRFTLPLVAVTGSNGKTTVKEMLAAILRKASREKAQGAERHSQRVLATLGNLNNEIGMPLMLLRLRENHQYGVIEMGMNHAGEIAYLTQLAKPDVAVITNASTAHIAGLGSAEAIAQAKGEIFSGLDESGVAIINADDCYAPLWRELAGKRKIIEFGLDKKAPVTAEFETDVCGSTVRLHLPSGTQNVNLGVPGIHNVRNSLAAAAAAVALDVDGETIAAGLESFEGVTGRLQRRRGLNQSVLIDDCYNANPESVRAALSVLAEAAGTKILVLGDMGELGTASGNLHRSIGEDARRFDLDKLFTIGKWSKYTSDAYGQGAQHFDDMETLLETLEHCLDADVTVLIKGSRFMQMERIADRLAG